MTQPTTPEQAPSRTDFSVTGGLLLNPPDVQRMILLHHQFHWGAARIARELGTTRNTVRRYLRQGGYQPYSRQRSPHPLDPHMSWLNARFFALGGNTRVLLRELVAKGVEVSYSVLVRTVRPSPQSRGNRSALW